MPNKKNKTPSPSRMEIDSGSDMEVDSVLATYLETTDRLTRWRSYFDQLVHVAIQISKSLHAKPVEGQEEIPVETIYSGLIATETSGSSSIQRLEQKLLAEKYSIFRLPACVFYDFLDAVFGMDASNVASSNPTISQREVHMLHVLEKASPKAKEYIGVWIESSYVKDGFDSFTRSFPNYEAAAAEYQNLQKMYASSSLDHLDMGWQIGVERGLRTGSMSLGFTCAMNCVDCLDFLIRHKLIHAEGYDGYGFSWLDGAIRAQKQDVFLYLLDKLEKNQFYNYPSVQHLRFKHTTYDAKMAIFRIVARENWTWAVMHLLGGFIKEGKVKKLPEYIDQPTKALLLRFVDERTAEALRKGGYDLSDVSFPVPAEEQSPFHVVALHNPHGQSIISWLYINTQVEVGAVNFKGKDALQIAASGNRPECIQWLCGHLDPLKIWERPSDGRFLVNEYTGCALELAARNMTNVSVFETMMNCVGDDAFEDFDLPLSLYKAVFAGLYHFTTKSSHIPPAATEAAYEVSILKSNVIKARLTPKWLQSAEMEEAMSCVWRYGFSNLAGSVSSFSNADLDRQAARRNVM